MFPSVTAEIDMFPSQVSAELRSTQARLQKEEKMLSAMPHVHGAHAPTGPPPPRK